MELRQKLFTKVSEIILGSRDEKDIKELTESLINSYSEFIFKEIDDSICNNLRTSKAKIQREIESAKSVMINSISYFLKGNIFEAVNEVVGLFKFLDERVITTHNTLYRGRVSNSNYLFNREEMFHIPLNNRNLVKNQRFSLSGFPCLYLGETSFSCWEELERPDYGMTNFVSLKSTRDLKLIDLTFPSEIESIVDIVKISIIIACSLKANKEDDFKLEYILPQLILHCFINQRNLNQSNFDGIAYHSISVYNVKEHIFQFQEDMPRIELDRYISYVLPVSDVDKTECINSKHFCSHLVNLFNISESISSNTRVFQRSLTSNKIPDNYEKHKNLYQNSCFADIDMYLAEASMARLVDVCKRASNYDPDKGCSFMYTTASGFSGELPSTPNLNSIFSNRKPKCNRLLRYRIRLIFLTLSRAYKSFN